MCVCKEYMYTALFTCFGLDDREIGIVAYVTIMIWSSAEISFQNAYVQKTENS